MDFFTVTLIAVGLAMDCFAVAITSGIAIKQLKINYALQIALFFGGFQALMPIMGWLAGVGLRDFISNIDHWIAFGLLSAIGLKMVYESRKLPEDKSNLNPLNLYVLSMLSIVTSIDALAVGVSFAFLKIPLISSVILIGTITFLISFIGVFVGNRTGHFFENKIEFAGGLILIGIGFKISMVPLHLWTPDVYQGAPAPVTAFLATGSKVAFFSALLRFAYYYSGSTAENYYVFVFWILAFLTMVVGNITALAQSRVKRLLAYSSIAQIGYLLMTLLAVRESGVFAIMFYLTVYALMDLGAFGTLATLSAKEEDLDVLDDFRGLAYIHPWRSALLTVCLVSLAGLPPTAGFMGKFILFRAVLQARFIVLAALGIVTVMVSIYFYFKVIVALFMQPMGRKPVTPDLDLFARIAGIVVLILILWLGLLPSSLLSVIERIVSSLSL